MGPCVVAHTINPRTWELEASLVYLSEFEDSQGYSERSCLKRRRRGGEGKLERKEEEEEGEKRGSGTSKGGEEGKRGEGRGGDRKGQEPTKKEHAY